MKVTLTVLTGPRAGEDLVFDGPATVEVGRSPDCALVLPAGQAGVSRRHALIEIDPPGARVRDLGSTNGTWINQSHLGGRGAGPTEAVPLAHDDRIGVGETVLLLTLEAPDGVARPVRCGCGVVRDSPRARPGGHLCGECDETVRDTPADRAARAEAPDAAVFEGYRLVRTVGAGGMGKVYLAVDTRTGEQVALKVLAPQVAVDEKNRKDFLREMGIAGALAHPNLVARRGQGSAGQAFWFAMEYCPGGNLTDRMQRRGGPLPPDEAIDLVVQALEGLAFMHAQGFVHRDLKPQNILLTQDEGGVPKLADFGLAKSFEQAGLTGMTITGSVRGTPHFTPREQVTNYKYVKPVSDVWSMGATLYYLLSGDVPRGATAEGNPMLRALTVEALPLRSRAPRVPQRLADVVDRALATDPAARFQNAQALQRALRTVR